MFTTLTIAMTLTGAVPIETPSIKADLARPALVQVAANGNGFGKGKISSGERERGRVGKALQRVRSAFDNGGPGIFGANLAAPPGGNKPFGNAKGSNGQQFGNGKGSNVGFGNGVGSNAPAFGNGVGSNNSPTGYKVGTPAAGNAPQGYPTGAPQGYATGTPPQGYSTGQQPTGYKTGTPGPTGNQHGGNPYNGGQNNNGGGYAGNNNNGGNNGGISTLNPPTNNAQDIREQIENLKGNKS